MKPLLTALLLALLTGCVTPPIHEPGQAPPFTEIDSFRFWQECGM
jgi:hypothetical protein